MEGFMNFEELPDELKAQLVESFNAQRLAHDLWHVKMESEAHALEAFFTGLDADATHALISWLQNLMSNEETMMLSIAAAIGDLTRQHAIKANVCGACGKNHDEELQKQMQAATSEPQMSERAASAILDLVENDMTLRGEPEVPIEKKATIKELMEQYRMERVEEDGAVVLRCKDCKYPSQSLTDRMMKAPDECPGCFIKSAHG